MSSTCTNDTAGQNGNTNNNIVKYGKMTRDVFTRGAQYAVEHPQDGPVTAIRVGKLVANGAGGFAIGVTVDIAVNNESWPQAVASQAVAWSAGGLAAIGIFAICGGAPVAAVAVLSVAASWAGNRLADGLWEWSSTTEFFCHSPKGSIKGSALENGIL